MATFTKTSKSSTPTWTKAVTHPAVLTHINKGSGPNQFLLLETGGHILLEDGVSRIILEQSSTQIQWTKITKN